MISERPTRLRPGLLALCLALAAAFSSNAQEPIAPGVADAVKVAKPALAEAMKAKNVESFDVVWTTIRDKHFDPLLNGVDWDAARDELRPKVEQAESMADARAVLTDLIERLGQSHFGILPSSVYEAIEEADDDQIASGDGVTGIEVRVVDGKALVVSIDEGSAAEKAGVRPGWTIEKVEGKEAGPAIEKVMAAYKDSTLLDLYLSRVVANRLGGPVGQSRKVEFRDGEDQPREVEIVLDEPPGNPTRFGNLPVVHVTFKGKKVDGDIGYMAFNMFFDPAGIAPQVEAAVRENLDAPGMILDLRGNPGGIGAMAMGVAGWFVTERDRKLGTMMMRNSTLRFTLNRRADPYKGPLAVLVDGCSASTSEILVGGLKDLGRARVFGTKTAGAALPSAIVRLPNGDGFQYAFANYISEGGQPLEGKGVTPDEIVQPDRKALLEGRDPVVDAAVRWIRSQADDRPEASN